MELNNGLSVKNLREFDAFRLEPSDFRNPVVYADYMMMQLSQVQRVTIGVIAGILVALSVVGNAATLWVNARRKIRPVFRTCLLSLALSDLTTAVFQGTSYLAQMSVNYVPIWILGPFMCSAIPFTTTMAILANSFTLVGIALDRYFAVVKIVKGSWEPSGILCGVFALGIWALAAGISSPMWNTYFIVDVILIETSPLNRSQEVGVSYVQSCASVKEPNLYYYSVVFLVIFLPMVMAFVWLNATIAKEIWRRRRPLDSSTSSNSATTAVATHSRSAPNCSTNSKNKLQPMAVDNCAYEVDDASEEKRTSETNTVSNELNGKRVMQSVIASPSSALHSAAMRTRSTREIRQLRMFRVILVIVFAFLLCRLPTWIYLLYKLDNVANTNLHWVLQYVFGMVSILNGVLNPMMYTFLTETIHLSFTFFDRAKRLVMCRVCRPNVNATAGVAQERLERNEQRPRFYCSEDRKVKMARLN